MRYSNCLDYRKLRQQIKESDEKKRKSLYKELNELYKWHRLNEYSLHEDVKEMQHHFKENIDSFTAQKIATRAWKAMEELLYGDGGNRNSFKKCDINIKTS